MKQSKATDFILPAFCAVIMTVCSWIYIPSAIPFTLQTFAVFLVTALFGAKCGLISLIIYIALGLVGVPVFSGFNSGFGVISGPTGGYIIGFIFIPIIYYIFNKIFKGSVVVDFSALLIGLIVCYAFGSAWFVLVYNKTGGIGIIKTLSLCVVPFIIPDLIKLSLAIVISRKTKPIIKKMDR